MPDRRFAVVIAACLAFTSGCTIVADPQPTYAVSPKCGRCGMPMPDGQCFMRHPGASCVCGGIYGNDMRCLTCGHQHSGAGSVAVRQPVYQPAPVARPATVPACPTCGYTMFNGVCNQPHARANAPCPTCGTAMLGGRCYQNHVANNRSGGLCGHCGVAKLLAGPCHRCGR